MYKCFAWVSMSRPGVLSLETGISPVSLLSAKSSQYSFAKLPMEAGIWPINLFELSDLYRKENTVRCEITMSKQADRKMVLTGISAATEILLRMVFDQKIHNQRESYDVIHDNSHIISIQFTPTEHCNIIWFSYKLVSFFKSPIEGGRGPVMPMLDDKSLYNTDSCYQKRHRL